VFPEVSGDTDFFNRALLSGFIPPPYLSNSPEEDLRSYVGAYLQEDQLYECCDAQAPRLTVRVWFQHIFLELKAYIDEFQPGSRITYWRSTSGYEVDFIRNNEGEVLGGFTSPAGRKFNVTRVTRV